MTILRPQQFRTVAEAGLGHPGPTMAPTMAWFQNKLYIGTAATMAGGVQDGARLHCFEPETHDWSMVFESPVLPLDIKALTRAKSLGFDTSNSPSMSRDFGIRSMVVFQGASDPHPCLYCGTMSIWGGVILRSEDGRHFETVAAPGIEDDRFPVIQGLSVLDGVLYAAPTGTVEDQRFDRHLGPPEAVVYASNDPVKDGWRRASAPVFGDPVNTGIASMATAHGFVYAGTSSPTRGFQLWRTDGRTDGDALPTWERVLIDGAFRFNLNFAAAHLCAFRGDLYVGTGTSGFAYDIEPPVDRAAVELIRVHPDASWDLIVGDLRLTPDGLKVPLSAMGSGFSNLSNSAIGSLDVHRDTLYLGMLEGQSDAGKTAGETDQVTGGNQLWASMDGDDWELVLDQDDGKITSTGIRTICSTPKGLFISTTNDARMLALRMHGRDDGEENKGFDVLLAED